METSAPAGALLSPTVNSAHPARRQPRTKRAKVREEVDSADIDAKTFEEAEASIKALVEGTEPRLITKSDGTSAPGRIQANGDVETDDSFTEFEILSEVNPSEADVTSQSLEDDEIDSDEVLDKIFDAAKSGNSEDFNRLLFVGKNGEKSSKVKKSKKTEPKSKPEVAKDVNELPTSIEQLLTQASPKSKKRKCENDQSVVDSVNNDAAASKNKKRAVDFRDVKNTSQPAAPAAASSSDPDPKSDTAQVGLIDYSVLTSALTKTLQENLQGGENDVKIVIFCNNKPIQSFSLRNNISEVAATIEETQVNKPHQETKAQAPSNTRAKSSSSAVPETTVSDKKGSVGSDNKLEASVTNNKEVNGKTDQESTVNTQSPPKLPARGFKRLSSGKKKSVNASTFLRIKGSTVLDTPVNGTQDSEPDNTADADSDEDSDKLVINTEPEVGKAGIYTVAGIYPVPSSIKLQTPVQITAASLSATPVHSVAASQSPQPVQPIPATQSTTPVHTVSGTQSTTPVHTVSGTQSTTPVHNIAATQSTTPVHTIAATQPPLPVRAIPATQPKWTPPTQPPTSVPPTTISSSQNEVFFVNNVAQFQCEICLKTFNLRRTLNRHKLRQHNPNYNKLLAKPLKEGLNSVEAPVAVPRFESLVPPTQTVTGTTLIAGTTETSCVEAILPTGEAVQLEVDLGKVKTEPLESVEPAAEGEKDSNIDYIQSILAKGPLADILQSKNTSQSTKVSCLRNVIQHVENAKAKRIDLPVDSNGEIQPVFVCEACGRYYRSRKTLKDHFMREHAKNIGEEPLYLYIAGNKYQCTVCFKYFHSASELLAHTKTHTGELLSPCNICGKVYASVHVLRRHIDNVHSEVRPRPFRCQLCDYAASNKWHLKEHHRRHTGEQPFICPICHKSFSHQGTMNRHCKTVHRFDSSSLSREQQRLHQGLTSLTVPSLQLTGSQLTLADLSTPNFDAESVLSSIPLLTSTDELSTATSNNDDDQAPEKQITELTAEEIASLDADAIADLAAEQIARLAAVSQNTVEEIDQSPEASTSESTEEGETPDSNTLHIDMTIVKTEPLETF